MGLADLVQAEKTVSIKVSEYRGYASTGEQWDSSGSIRTYTA